MFYLMMCFIFIHSKLYLFKALFIQSFLFHPLSHHFQIAFIHFFQTLKFLSNPKNFKQTLSIACL
ncbi:hypothetical protein ECC27_07505 [Helicobacter pylori]|nr:hypothetical protein ECC27_07505 [Helicobacter pylori]